MNVRTLVVLSTVFVLPLVSRADSIPPFGVASAYNLVALGTLDSKGNLVGGTINDSADVTGRIAAAGKVTGTLDIGQGLNNDPWASAANIGGTTYDFVAAGGFSGQANIGSHGDAFAPGSTGHFNFNGGGHIVSGTTSPIDFNGLRISLQNQATFLGGLPSTPAAKALGLNASIPGAPSVHINPSMFVLYAGDNTLDVFNISATDFASQNIDIHTNPGQNPTIIINVTGTTAISGGPLDFNENQDFNSELTSNVLFNFPDATTVTVHNGELAASILAPFALVTAGGDIDGNIIAASIGATEEDHNIEFTGTLPTPPPVPHISAVPEPGTLALVGTGLLSAAGVLRRKKGRLLS